MSSPFKVRGFNAYTSIIAYIGGKVKFIALSGALTDLFLTNTAHSSMFKLFPLALKLALASRLN